MSRVCHRVLNIHSVKLGQFRFLSAAQATKANEYDLVVVGGGIIGVASAREFLLKHPKLRMAILEKESKLAQHQSSHNSGVIHAGIYYAPGSLKAKLCGEGMQLMYKYLDEKKIPYKKCGKLIVATNQVEIERLKRLEDRAIQNKVPDLKVLNGKELQEIEPHCRGLKALWSPHTGIVSYQGVVEHYAKDFQEAGGSIFHNFEVTNFKKSDQADYPVIITSKRGESMKAKHVLTCGGLHSDMLAQLSGCSPEPRIIPFRGEYLILNPDKSQLVKGNIYPVPDPKLPFLGVHFTPRLDGSVLLGPNAVLAFRREGYRRSDIQLKELVDVLRYPGLQRMVFKYLFMGMQETAKSMFMSLQVKDLQKYIPEISVKDVSRGPTGVRAQAMDLRGNLVEDFYFDQGKGELGPRILHCRNAPSPGATSSLAIAKMIREKLEKEFQLG